MNKQARKILIPTLIFGALLWGTAHATAPVSSDEGVVFSFSAPDAQAVFLAGTFNGWNAADLALAKADDGIWRLTVPLSAGDHEYKFVVDGAWLADPDNPLQKSDPFGGSNSLVQVGPDGRVAASPTSATAPAAPAKAPAAAPAPSVDDIQVGAPRSVDGGIMFTYQGDASSVNLAGNFNGWNATELPLTTDGQNRWVIIHPLPAGSHEYKLVIDGAWFADPENPDTQADPYGGANSLVTVDDNGQLIAAAAAPAADDQLGANTTLNARLNLGGRYLTRMELAKNVLADPRWRLQRPTQSVDLNFTTEVSDLVKSFMRIRLDADQNLIQNNIAGFLDEAHLALHPDNFSLRAFWNEEVFTSEDVMLMGGNVDLPGTIGHDHLNYGKGTAGALFQAYPWDLKFRGFFANIHNQDYYNDPELFDNTGGDAMGVRLSKQFGPWEVGLPAWLERELVWLNLEDRVSLPSTGLPTLDDHLANTGDSSTWFETDSHAYRMGLDLRYRLNETWLLSGQGTFLDESQQFVTGNESGQNNSNGALEVPILERDSRIVRLQLDYTPDNLDLMFHHTRGTMDGASAAQRQIGFNFQPQATANKQIFFEINDNPALTDHAFTELELDWHRNDRQVKFWAWHRTEDRDYAAGGTTVPADSTRTDSSPYTWYVSGLVAAGNPSDRLGHAELEFGLRLDDLDVTSLRHQSTELIARYDRNLTRELAAIADFRYIHYDLESQDAAGAVRNDTNDYFSPFLGLRYRPLPKFEMVFGYGVDPVDYSIAYGGRQMGRWWHRQNFLFDNPEADLQDAENNLAKARVFTLRAQFIF